MIVITQRPEKTIDGKTSTWNESGNPIVYKMQRKDYSFDAVDNSGNLRLQFLSVNLTSSFTIGDSIYLKSDNGTYVGFATVTNVSFSGGNTYVTTSVAYSGAATTGFVNNMTKRPGYHVEINLYDNANVLINESPYMHSPDATGYLLVDVSGIIRNTLSPDNDIDLDTDILYDDVNVYERFYLGRKEVWVGSAESETSDSANKYFAVLGARQIPALYGGNLADFVTFTGGTLFPNMLTKFISTFTQRGKIWRGFPNLFSVISGEELTGLDTEFEIFFYDSDNNLISSYVTPQADNSGKVLVVNIGAALPIPANATHVQIQFRIVSPNTVLITSPTFEVVEPCKNPVMLMARNSLGGVMQWVFDYSQENEYDLRDDKKAEQSILSTNQLSINEWECLHDFITLGDVYKNNILELTPEVIKTSTRIGQQVYRVYEDFSKLGVITLPTRNNTLTKYVKHSFELEIEYPEVFEA